MPQPRMMLVITGDDFGYCPQRNQGIVECFQARGITTVSLLVNASATKEAADLAKRHNIPIGLHANLSEGIPVCPSHQQASTLTNQCGFFHGKMGFRQALERGQLSMNQVEVELRAQIKLFQDLTGHLPHHMDGHQHVHVLPGGEGCPGLHSCLYTIWNQMARCVPGTHYDGPEYVTHQPAESSQPCCGCMATRL
ncbi:carbohydrate deacetylase isoform X2 [Takifugu flavidus]|uniref:carbohydrate deacetylase isoform X2 n=1 Tax=Takifugu flavidus TaxID=433684 RepID=UPI002544BBA6|nr:carbohydrate deacetylase isoform X2 [Takifugu flavidus]